MGAVAVLPLAACSDGADRTGVDAAPTTTEAPKRLRVITAYAEQDATRLETEIRAFEDRTGIDVDITNTSGDFIDRVSMDATATAPHDIALIPQPSVYQQLVREGRIKALPETLAQKVRRNQNPALVALGETSGAPSAGAPTGSATTGSGTGSGTSGSTSASAATGLHGVWLRAAPYSIVWYRRDVFAAKGWTLPTTLSELEALEARIIADGTYQPWCIGAEAEGATGWVLTDWVEQYLMAVAGPDVYDRWTRRELPMNAPEVVDAVNRLVRLTRTPGMVTQSPEAIITTKVERSIDPMLAATPRCLMHRQIDWITNEFPADVTTGEQGMVDVGPFPDADGGKAPALLGGDIAASFTDRPEAWSLLEFLTDPDFGVEWARSGGFMSPNVDFPVTAYPKDWQRRNAATLETAPVARFDASDMMPTATGSGLLWSALVRVVQGAPVQATLDELETQARAAEQQPPPGK